VSEWFPGWFLGSILPMPAPCAWFLCCSGPRIWVSKQGRRRQETGMDGAILPRPDPDCGSYLFGLLLKTVGGRKEADTPDRSKKRGEAQGERRGEERQERASVLPTFLPMLPC
jgi:hypothetical protein